MDAKKKYSDEDQKEKKDFTVRLGKSLFVLILVYAGFVFGNATATKQPPPLDSAFLLCGGQAQGSGKDEEGRCDILRDKNFNARLYADLWKQIHESYVHQPIDDRALFYGSLKGMVSALGDPYSNLFTPDEAQDFEREISGSFEGIGAQIGIKKNVLTIIAPLQNSPAELAGLRAGDKIYKINDVETSGLGLDQAVLLIRGQKGTSVQLTVLRGEEKDFREISVTRDEIEVDSVTWKMLDERVAFITLTHFNEGTDRDFAKTAKEVLAKNPRALILDLRNNPGGLLPVSLDIAGFWISGDTVVIQKDSHGDEMKSNSPRNRADFAGLKTIVLINKGSASAAEILAGALQDYGFATLVGEKTFGKGSVQDYHLLEDEVALKITIAEWLTPKGRSIDKEGISPDIQIELTDEDFDNDKDPQLDKAIELFK